MSWFTGAGTVAAAGLSLIGSAMTNKANAKIAQQQMAFQAQQAEAARRFDAEQAGLGRDFSHTEAQLARDYDTSMSNTAYQRAHADMMAAGLNPILMADRGGASTPSAPLPSASVAHAGGVPSGSHWQAENGIGKAASSALNAFGILTTAEKLGQEVEQSKAQVSVLQQEAELKRAETARTEASTALDVERSGLIAPEIRARIAQLGASGHHAEAQALASRYGLDMRRTFGEGPTAQATETGARVLGNVADVVRGGPPPLAGRGAVLPPGAIPSEDGRLYGGVPETAVEKRLRELRELLGRDQSTSARSRNVPAPGNPMGDNY